MSENSKFRCSEQNKNSHKKSIRKKTKVYILRTCGKKSVSCYADVWAGIPQTFVTNSVYRAILSFGKSNARRKVDNVSTRSSMSNNRWIKVAMKEIRPKPMGEEWFKNWGKLSLALLFTASYRENVAIDESKNVRVEKANTKKHWYRLWLKNSLYLSRRLSLVVERDKRFNTSWKIRTFWTLIQKRKPKTFRWKTSMKAEACWRLVARTGAFC